MINWQMWRCVPWALLAVAGLTGIAVGDYEYKFAGYNAPSASLEALFGPALRSPVDARAEGFNFGDGSSPLRNFNVISQVFRANQTVSISPQITLLPGDLTFAYTLDYTGTLPGVTENPVTDFQLLRVVSDPGIFVDPPGISNPGPVIALDNIIGGAYNTFTDYNGLPLKDQYGFTGVLSDYPELGYLSNFAQFSWVPANQLMPRKKAMVLLFARDVTYRYIGSAGGVTGEGGNVLAGVDYDHFPVLVPVVPEPASLLMLIFGGTLLCRRQRQNR